MHPMLLCLYAADAVAYDAVEICSSALIAEGLQARGVRFLQIGAYQANPTPVVRSDNDFDRLHSTAALPG